MLATTALAGCSALPGVGGSGDPDAGTDAYGLGLTNKTEQAYTVTAGPRGSDTVDFEETAESTPGEDREWDQAVTGEGLYVVEAAVDADHFVPDAGQPRPTITVGTETARDEANLLVEVLPAEVEGATVGIRCAVPQA